MMQSNEEQEPASPGGAASLQTASGSRLRATILLEATRMFAERGYAGTSIREVVGAAGCTKPALYYYFTNKEALYAEVIAAETELARALLERTIDQEGPLKARIIASLVEYFEHISESPWGFAVLMRAEVHPGQSSPVVDLSCTRRGHDELLQRLIEEAMQRGEVRADVAPAEAAMLLGAFAERTCSRIAFFREEVDHASITRVVDLFFRGVAA